MQQPQPLCHHLGGEEIDSGRVAAGPGEAGDQTELDRVLGDAEGNRNGRGRRLGRECRCRAPRHRDEAHLPANQIGHQGRKPIELVVGRAGVDRHVLALDVADFGEAAAECAQTRGEIVGDVVLSTPITGIAGCCACAANGNTAAAPTTGDEFAAFQSIECHLLPSPARQHSGLASMD